MLNQIVRVIFKERIQEVFKEKNEIQKFLISHERFDLVCNNLIDEIREMESRGLKLDVHKLRTIISGVCDVFMKAALEQKKQQMMSDNEKRALDAKNSRMNDVREMLAELNNT